MTRKIVVRMRTSKNTSQSIYFHNNVNDKKNCCKNENQQKHAKFNFPVPLIPAHHQLMWKKLQFELKSIEGAQ